MHIGEAGVEEPMWVYLNFITRTQRQKWFHEHSSDIQEITRVVLHTPVPVSSSAARRLVEAGVVHTEPSAGYALEIEFDHNRKGQRIDLGPDLPLSYACECRWLLSPPCVIRFGMKNRRDQHGRLRRLDRSDITCAGRLHAAGEARSRTPRPGPAGATAHRGSPRRRGRAGGGKTAAIGRCRKRPCGRRRRPLLPIRAAFADFRRQTARMSQLRKSSRTASQIHLASPSCFTAMSCQFHFERALRTREGVP
jgi:hypothetical protein